MLRGEFKLGVFPTEVSEIELTAGAMPIRQFGFNKRKGLNYLLPPDVCSFSITSSRLKLAAFCRCGNSLKVIRNFPT
jgi:hypothetical protein